MNLRSLEAIDKTQASFFKCHLIEYVREIYLEMKDKKPHKISR